MPDFREGQKVRAVASDYCTVRPGDIGTVLKCRPNGYDVLIGECYLDLFFLPEELKAA